MPTTDHDRTHEVLSRGECLSLLRSATIGRLAYSEDALPAIRPVSFALRGDEVCIPLVPGSTFLDALRGSVVAFEADDYDPARRTGWTVVVVGPSRVLECPAAELPPPGACLVAVRLGLVHGWRTTTPP